jgi:hypothetical protein
LLDTSLRFTLNQAATITLVLLSTAKNIVPDDIIDELQKSHFTVLFLLLFSFLQVTPTSNALLESMRIKKKMPHSIFATPLLYL